MCADEGAPPVSNQNLRFPSVDFDTSFSIPKNLQVPERAPAHRIQRRKIVFLDVDGVLHPADGSHGMFAPPCVQLLIRIIRETEADIVLSTSWRVLAQARKILLSHIAHWGLPPPIGCTPQAPASQQHAPLSSVCRAGEISTWLTSNRHLVDYPRWVAIDDLDMSSQLTPHMIHTDRHLGLTVQDAEWAIARLNTDDEFCACDLCCTVGGLKAGCEHLA